MTTTIKPPIVNPRMYRPVLVSLDVATTLLQLDARTVDGMIQSGHLLWAFHVGRGDQIRCLRFWYGELLWFVGRERGAHYSTMPMHVGIDSIIGTQAMLLSTHRVGETLGIDKCSVKALLDAGLITFEEISGRKFVHRPSLAKFLQDRRLS